jgi:hypothetical protein
VSHQAGAYQPLPDREKELQLTGRLIGKGDLEPLAGPASVDMVGRGILGGVSRRIGDGDAVADARIGPTVAEGLAEPQRVTCASQQLGVAEHNLPGVAWLDGKHLGSNQALARKREQGRILSPPDDLFIDRARLLRVHRLPPDLLIPHPERKVGEDGLTRHGLQVAAFGVAAAGFGETLLDFDWR